jgi:STE24 endopeptidase
MRHSLITSILETAVLVAILVFGLHAFFYEWAGGITENMYLRVYIMFAAIWVIMTPLGIVTSAIETFKIEAKYGFNKTGVGTFIRDFIVGTIFQDIVFSLGLLTVFMALHARYGNTVFILFIFVLLFAVLFVFFIGKFIQRLFYKLTPLEEGELKSGIADLSQKMGYPLAHIYIADFSRRTTKSNAMFTGFGKMKTVILADNLVEKFTTEEILAVVAHEIGHNKGKHLWKRMPLQIAVFASILVLAYFVVGHENVSTAFGFQQQNVAFAMFITMTLAMPLLTILSIPGAIISRKHEYEADAYGTKFASREASISGMKKIYRENFGSLTPHPFVVFTSHSHPPAAQRIAAMEE